MSVTAFLSKTPSVTNICQIFSINGRLLTCGLYTGSREEYLVKVAVIGDPNAGKSTLVNTILGRQINAVSKKVHTTRHKTLTVLNAENTQIVFADTPGFVGWRSTLNHNVEKSLLVDAYESLSDVDVVVAVHDVNNYYTKYELTEEIKKAFRLVPENTRTVLALNKVDLLPNKSDLLSITKRLVKQPENTRRRKTKSLREMFDAHDRRRGIEPRADARSCQSDSGLQADAVFMVSALEAIGIESLKKYLIAIAKPSPWLYDMGFITDQSTEEMISMCVKAKMLDLLFEETPYSITPKVDLMCKDESSRLNIFVSLPCENKRLASALMGPSGSTIRSVALSAEQSLSEAFGKPVVLKLVITNRKKTARSS